VTTLVTGGAGYIGSVTARALAASGRSVVVLDTLERGRREACGDLPLVIGNIADAELVTKVCADHGVDEVVHFAAYKAVGESMSDPGLYFDNNVAGSHALIEAVRRAGVERFVFSSSAAVYGTPSSVPVDERAPVRCESVYAETKAMVERMLHWYGETVGLRSVCLRYFNAAGASDDGTLGEDWDRSQNLLPHVMRAALEGVELRVFGGDYPTADGTGVRDYVHVEDLAVAHVSALDHLAAGRSSLVCNVGTGRGTSVLEIVRAAEEVLGVPVPRVIVDRRPGDPASCWADVALARDVLGFAAVRGLESIIDSARAWHTGAGRR